MAAKTKTKKPMPTSNFSNQRFKLPAAPSGTRRTYTLEARDITVKILEETDLDSIHPADLFNKICDNIDSKAYDHNANIKDSKRHWPIISSKGAPLDTIARFIAKTYHMCHIQTSNDIRNIPIYTYMTTEICENPALLGTYSDDPTVVRRCIHEWSPGISEREMVTIIGIIHEVIPNVPLCIDEDLVPCNNVIVNVRERTYYHYGPEFVFTSKITTDYDPDAEMPQITQKDGSIWTPDTFIPSFTSSPDTAALLLKVAAAAMRFNKDWKISPWLYSTVGNNGKGTFCALIRNLIGTHGVADLSIKQLGDHFYAAQVVGKAAVIGDENPVGAYIDNVETYKRMVTCDPIVINQKYEKVYSYVFRGMILQCVNDFPRVKDRSGSWTRRLLPIEFDQCFTGRVNSAIKDDYIKRPEVLRWFLKTLLDLQFDEIQIPEESKALLEAYREINDPVREFCNDIGPRLTSDLIPHVFIYQLYLCWMRKNNPATPVLGRNTFISQWTQTMTEKHEWIYPAGTTYYSSKGRFGDGEEVLLDFPDMPEPWVNNRVSRSKNPLEWCKPIKVSPQYRGILRRIPKHAIDPNRPDYALRVAEHEDHTLTSCNVDEALAKLEFTDIEVTEAQQ